MKVKVSYTVDLDDIPSVVKGIVKKAEIIQSEMQELSSKLHEGDLGANSLSNINKLREMSSQLLENYSDCESILSGFLSAVFSKNDDQEVVPNDNAQGS